MSQSTQKQLALTSAQLKALDAVLKEESNICICGIAGTGKSQVIAQILSRSTGLGKYTEEQIGVCASTGTAASLLDGSTIHSLLGLGPITASTSMEDVFGRIYGQRETIRRIKKLRLLIIDEISMVQSGVLRVVRAVLEKFCQEGRPYGGVRIVAVGDMKQLPPVVVRGSDDTDAEFKAKVSAAWPFSGDQWEVLKFKYVVLDVVVRTDDRQLQQIICNVSNEMISAEDMLALNSRKRDTDSLIVINPKTRVVLCATKAQVDTCNIKIMEKCLLYKQRFELDAQDVFSGALTERRKEKLEDDVRLSRRFVICKNAIVMYHGPPQEVTAYNRKTKQSMKVKVVNGSLGEVVDFGTLEFAKGRIEEGAQGIIGELVQGRTPKALQVQFKHLPEGFWVFVGEREEKVDFEGASLTRKQYAVVVSFAMTLHKAQGQTFDSVHLAIENSHLFTYGLFYVAISRVKSLSNLTIDKKLQIDKINLLIHPDVRMFFESHFPDCSNPPKRPRLER